MAVLAAASSMSACIIPVAPNFQDPPPQPSSVPDLKVTGTTRPSGSTVSIQTSFDFSVTVDDPDPNVTVYFRWVFDYPLYTNATRAGNGPGLMIPAASLPFSLTQRASCDSIDTTIQPANGAHNLNLLASPSDFVNASETKDALYDTVLPNAPVASMNWTIIFSGCTAASP